MQFKDRANVMIKTSAYANINEYVLPGTFGDMEVKVSSSSPRSPIGVNVILLHGVHSSANMGQHNKFRFLAEILSDSGFTPWLVETSRRIRNRQDFPNDVTQWIRKAFSGKTFAEERTDVFNAICGIRSEAAGCPIWIWGFSLGGIIALSAAADMINCPDESGPSVLERVILSGTGLVAYKDVEERMMSLPILSTLRSEIPPDMLSHVRAKGLISFRGSCDEIFSEESCLGVLGEVNIPKRDKYFFTIEGADHSFRSRNGKADPGIMKEMVDHITNAWA